MKTSEAEALLKSLELTKDRVKLAKNTTEEELQKLLIDDKNKPVRDGLLINRNLTSEVIQKIVEKTRSSEAIRILTTKPMLSEETITYILENKKLTEEDLFYIIPNMTKKATLPQLIKMMNQYPLFSYAVINSNNFPIHDYEKYVDINNPQHLGGLASSPKITEEIFDKIINSPITEYYTYNHKKLTPIIFSLIVNRNLTYEMLIKLAPRIKETTHHIFLSTQPKMDETIWKLYLKNMDNPSKISLITEQYVSTQLLEILSKDSSRKVRNEANQKLQTRPIIN